MPQEVIIIKEIIFHTETLEELLNSQYDYIRALESLGFKYNIERTLLYSTNTPKWIVKIYK